MSLSDVGALVLDLTTASPPAECGPLVRTIFLSKTEGEPDELVRTVRLPRWARRVVAVGIVNVKLDGPEDPYAGSWDRLCAVRLQASQALAAGALTALGFNPYVPSLAGATVFNGKTVTARDGKIEMHVDPDADLMLIVAGTPEATWGQEALWCLEVYP